MHRVSLTYTLAGREPAQRDLHHPLMALLAAVHDTGSISAAARALGLSYRHVWGELKRWEGELGQELVIWMKGQAALLSPFGEKLLWAERRAQARLAPQIEALRGELEQAFAVAFDASAGVIPMYASHDDALPLLRTLADGGLDGMEVYNLHANIDPKIRENHLGLDAFGAITGLAPWLAGRTTLLLGQSGMGKSTLVNCLIPNAGLRTQEISTALDAGRHTTTFTRLFDLPAPLSGRIIDSPGFQTFGLEHLSESQRLHAMPECQALLGQCRFHSCTHRDEPGCAIRAAVKDGRIDERRYSLLLKLHEETRVNAPASWRR